MIDPLDMSSMRVARYAAKLTQTQLAQAVDTDAKAIGQIEQGKRDPKASTWIKIVRVIQAKLGEVGNGNA